jgi:MSHA biogenesis protein MshI
MLWPWQRRAARHDTLAFRLDDTGLHWVLADARAARPVVLGFGHCARPADGSPWDFGALRAEAAKAGRAIGLLPLAAYQMLQIDAPAVPSDELRAAARWHIRDRVDSHVDDLTLDVLRVGPALASPHGQGQLFVVAAANQQVQALGELAQQGQWPLQVIDVTDMAQRNLHASQAAALDLGERATACLVQHGKACLLTLCVGEELCYSRRLDWDAQLPERAQAALTRAAEPPPDHAWATELGGDGALSFDLADGGLQAAVELGASRDDDSRLVVELQRSFDVWERSWPDHPLSALLLCHEGDMTPSSAFLQTQLGLRVLPMNRFAAVEPGPLAQAEPAMQAALWPLLGALLRREPVEP